MTACSHSLRSDFVKAVHPAPLVPQSQIDMGGSTRANDTGKPGVAQLSGAGGGGLPVRDDAPPDDDSLTIELVNVDAQVAGSVGRGASVSIRSGSAFVSSRRLGDFSPDDSETVRRGSYTQGSVYSVSPKGPWAVVQLTK